jgi:hypothetical protein
MPTDLQFWIALALGAVVIYVFHADRFAQPSYAATPNEPFTFFPPSQLTTSDRYRRAKFVYAASILILFLLFSLLGPYPIKQFNIPVVEPSALPLLICTALVGISQIAFFDRLEGKVRRRFHTRAAILIVLPKLAGFIYDDLSRKFGDNLKSRLESIVDLGERAERLAQSRSGVRDFSFVVLDSHIQEIVKSRSGKFLSPMNRM